MRQIINITSENDQRHVLFFDGIEAVVRIRFMSAVQSWFLFVEYNDEQLNGVRLAAGCLHMRSKNWPFDFAVEITDKSGIDPFMDTDFSSGRCILYIVQPSEMESIRGQAV